MRLGFHYHIPAITKDGRICTMAPQGLFIDSLAECDTEIICFLHSPLEHEVVLMDYPVQSEKVHLVNLGLHTSIAKRTLLAGKTKRIIHNWRDQLDIMLIRGPSPLLPEIAQACGKIPTAILLVGDYLAGVDDLPQPAWRKELIRAWSWWNRKRQLLAARRSLTFVNSRLLHDQLAADRIPSLIEIRTTTLRESDFYPRSDTCLKLPYRLLYAGRIDRAKGLFEIVEAVSQLVYSGFDVVFDIVGAPAKNDSILGEIDKLARSLDIEERVIYHGYKSAGLELLSYYRQADLFVTASRANEGFPRTIWEAMASGLPVVATRVGSIPAFIDGSALLVPPKNVQALSQAIKDLLTCPHLRQELITSGLKLAQANTLEKQSKELVFQMNKWLIRNRREKSI